MPQLSQAQVVGLAIVILGVVLAVSWLLRRRIPILRTLFLPSSVIGGFLVLLLGGQVLGAATGTAGLFPAAVVDVWRTIPGLMINVVFAAIMIGKTLPSGRELWRSAAPHALLGTFLSFGQFALGGLVVLFFLGPVFGLPPEAGSLLELSFAGGHGTIAGMGGLLVDSGAGELVDVGLGLATISMLTGIGVGSALVRWALRHPDISLARTDRPGAADELDVDRAATVAGDIVPGEDSGSHPSAVAFAAIGLALLVSVALLWGVRWLTGLAGITIFDKLPLFPVAVVGGFLVQLAAGASGLDRYLDRRAINGISAIALDLLLICAIGTMSLATIGSNIPAVLTFTVIGVGWSVVVLVWLGRRFHADNWFEHAIADFGQSQGNVATGFVLADMTDPLHVTTAARDYGYKQLLYEPFLGGGLLTALSVPLIASLGLPAFTGFSVVATVVVGWLGVRAGGSRRAAARG